MERAGQITAFRDKVATLRKEWEGIAAAEPAEMDDEQSRSERRNLGRLHRGLRTPAEAYRVPVLKVLSELGGPGRAADALAKVAQASRGVLKDVDRNTQASDPDLPR